MAEKSSRRVSDPTSKEAEYLQILAESLESGVSILDENMNYLFLSDSVYTNIGATPDALKVGDHLSKCHEIMVNNGLFTQEVLKRQKLSAEEQIQKNAAGEKEGIRLVSLGDGTTHRFVRKSLPNGKTVSIADDVSELVEKDKLLEQALALGNAGYWSLDLQTKKCSFSKGLYAFYGSDIGDKIQKTGFGALVHPEDRHILKTTLKKAVLSDDRFKVTCRAVGQKGQIRIVETNGEITRDVDRKPIRIQAFVRDVTEAHRQAKELEQAKDEAIAASRAKSQFLANMSHEIRTPMNGILGMAELLGNSEISERQRDFVSVINNSASALLNIINDILDFSKIEAGAFELDPVPFDLKSSINDVTALLRNAAQEKDIELIINYAPHLPQNFIGDVGRLRQVITNLVGNAIKFTEDGHIEINVDTTDVKNAVICTVDVKDTGIGIAPEKLNKIFDKFTQADGSTTRVYGGTGLGLTISKHIVEMMGGKMQVESNLGEGSSFGFKVPLPIDKNAKTEAFNTQLVAGKRVLIVDDILVNRSLFTEQLKSWGLKSETAIDGVDALSKIKAAQDKSEPFDLILLDFLMPGMNGQEFAQLLARAPTLDAPQIIMLSSCDQPVSTATLSRLGIDSYLLKPVREGRLFDTIVRVFSNPATHSLEPSPVELEDTEIARGAQKQEILVAEDFELNREVVKLMLAETCFEPVFATTGQEAVNLYRENPGRFPLILMDVSMPVMDGYEATKTIRAYELEAGISAIPIVALTGHALKNDREACLEAGMDDYLSKPVKQLQLIDKIETFSGRAIHIRQAG